MPYIGLMSFLLSADDGEQNKEELRVNALHRAYVISTPAALEALILAASGARFCK